MLNIMDIAPDFTLPSDGIGEIQLAALRPAPVVLFFYPRDNTPGCTTEAQDFTARAQAFADLDVRVFGISKDSLSSHQKFVAKRDLTIPLLSDADSDVCEAYGVWREKKMYGKVFMGIERSTFLINGEGQIAQVWRKVKVADHAEQVLAAARDL